MNSANANASVPSVALHWQPYGDCPQPGQRNLVILHGLFGSNVNWRTIATQLSHSHQVFCLDLRNHGQSPWHDDMGYRAMAADVARFIADHKLQNVSLLGHSMGGKIAMMLAQDAQVELSQLIVVDIAPTTYSAAAHLALLETMHTVNLATIANRKQVDAALGVGIDDPAIRQFLAHNLTKEADADGYRWRWKINLAAIQQNIVALAGYTNEQISTREALFIAGANSDYLTTKHHCQIFNRFPNACIKTVADAGHWLHVEQPASLLALCNAFLAK